MWEDVRTGIISKLNTQLCPTQMFIDICSVSVVTKMCCLILYLAHQNENEIDTESLSKLLHPCRTMKENSGVSFYAAVFII